MGKTLSKLFVDNANSTLLQFFRNALVGSFAIGLDPSGTLYTDLSTATAATINAIRTAFQVQRLLERQRRMRNTLTGRNLPNSGQTKIITNRTNRPTTNRCIVTGKQIGRAHV